MTPRPNPFGFNRHRDRQAANDRRLFKVALKQARARYDYEVDKKPVPAIQRVPKGDQRQIDRAMLAVHSVSLRVMLVDWWTAFLAVYNADGDKPLGPHERATMLILRNFTDYLRGLEARLGHTPQDARYIEYPVSGQDKKEVQV